MLHRATLTQVLLHLEHEREQKMSEILRLDREEEGTLKRIELRRVTLRAQIGQLSESVEALKAMSEGVVREPSGGLPPPLRTAGFQPLDTDASKVPQPEPDSNRNALVDYILAVEAEQSPTRMRRGLSPKEITTEIRRVFGVTLDFHKVNGHLWYLFRQKRMGKNDRYYFIPRDDIPDGAPARDVPSTDGA